MFRKKLLSLSLLAFALFVSVAFFGCDVDSSIELFQPNQIYEVQPGDTLEFSTVLENVNEEDVVFYVTGGADDTAFTGNILTVSQNEQVGADALTVYAQAGDVKSNEIKLNVVDLKASTIILGASNTKLAKGGEVDLAVIVSPTYATLKQTTLTVVEGAEFVDIVNNKVTVKETLENSEVVGETVKLQAVLNADNTIKSNIIEIDLVDNSVIAALVARNVNYKVGVNTNLKVGVDAYNEAGDLIDGQFSYSFVSDDEGIAYVQNDGTIIPHGHGKATITVTAPNGVDTTCDVYVMIQANRLELNDVNNFIQENKRFSYGKADELQLDIQASNSQYENCSQKLDYTFELLDEQGEVVKSGDSVATIANSKITFKQTGTILVTVKCNTSLNNVKWANEQSLALYVDVNNGINVSTVAEFKAYAEQTANPVVNVNADLYLTADNNFGGDDDRWAGLTLLGDREINGNGYELSVKDLPLKQNNVNGSDLLVFRYINSEFSVKIKDFKIIGCTNYDGDYVYDGSVNLGVHGGALKNTYSRAINISGIDYSLVEDYGKYFVDGLNIDNVYIDGFVCGIRISHSVDAYVSNVSIKNAYGNAIESNQNIITFNNMTFGQVGAFDIENTPDDMQKDTSGLHGTAGRNYDATPSITMTGYLRSANYNNGESTLYMQRLGFPIPTVINTIIAQTAQALTNDASKQSALTTFGQSLIFQNIAKQSEPANYCVNFYLLLFVDPTDSRFTEWVATNPQTATGTFGNYGLDTSMGAVLDITEAMTNANEQGAGYTDFTNYKYIKMDLRNLPGALLHPMLNGYTVNIGQVVVVNPLYQANANN